MDNVKVGSVLIPALIIAIGGFVLDVSAAYTWTGALLIVAGFIVAAWLFAVSAKYANADELRAKAELAKYLCNLPEADRQALALQLPEVGYQWRGGVFENWELTGVPMSFVRRFIAKSNSVYIMPERTTGDKTVERGYWRTMRDWLAEHGYIMQERTAANESWRWIGRAYKTFSSRYGGPAASIPNLGHIEPEPYAGEGGK